MFPLLKGKNPAMVVCGKNESKPSGHVLSVKHRVWRKFFSVGREDGQNDRLTNCFCEAGAVFLALYDLQTLHALIGQQEELGVFFRCD